ncbi:hypothetical protein BGX87_02505 [Burkholderia ubonensis]|nr:acyl-CoA dehydrogenase N-terminal domain-containing protein [Burkholderia ubonensis]OJA36994.1 hypothetical protein BGX87_02505 [Burkholderia ubonensis]
MSYTAPVKDMLFVLKELAGIDAVAQLPGFEDAGFDTAQAVLDESASCTSRSASRARSSIWPA